MLEPVEPSKEDTSGEPVELELDIAPDGVDLGQIRWFEPHLDGAARILAGLRRWSPGPARWPRRRVVFNSRCAATDLQIAALSVILLISLPSRRTRNALRDLSLFVAKCPLNLMVG